MPLSAVLDLLFGPCCLHCGGLLEGSRLASLCVECGRRLPRVKPPSCRTCGHPFSGIAGEGRHCRHCVRLKPVFGEGRTAILLRGPARTLVHHFKYRNARQVARDAAALFSDMPALADYLRGAVLVPVPLHPVKLWWRGYNQSELLARAAAEAAGVGEVRQLLKRMRFTRTQTRLDREGRSANLKNAFALAEAATLYPAFSCVLVDDVFTTGSTLNACAAVLRGAGCRRVDVLTLGHG